MRSFLFLTYCFFCISVHAQDISKSWSVYFDMLGSFSSPRAVDLNLDGVKDIVIGSGRHEFIPSDSGIMALNGVDGSLLWKAHSNDQMFGSAIFMDINEDNSPEVFINGRSGELYCLDGKTGKIIWEIFSKNDPIKAREAGFFNFYNPQFISDVTKDGLPDIIISNGGDVLAEPYDLKRPVGYLMIIDSRKGKVISKAFVPDGKETYLSVVAHDFDGDGSESVIYGTGGETIDGSLYKAEIKDILRGNLNKSIKLAEGNGKGFIAPPVLADINYDKILDIIAMSVDGRMLAINGKTSELIWQQKIPNTEAYSSLGLGMFNNDDIPDFYTTVNTGAWPNLDYTKSLIVNGRSGELIKSDTIGFYSTISPLIADFNNDKLDDILSHINFPNSDTSNTSGFFNTFTITDMSTGMIHRFGPSFPGSNSASTPWLGDLDNDGIYDIIYLYTKDPLNISNFSGMYINRFSTGLKVSKKVVWGSYMGSDYNGIYKDK